MAAVRVDVSPAVLRWAQDRSGVPHAELRKAVPGLAAWETGDRKPTVKQLEAFARKTFTPIGFLYLDIPPEEVLPLPDFRTFEDETVVRTSPNLLDTIYLCQERQDWYRDYASDRQLPAVEVVGLADETDEVQKVALDLREKLRYSVDGRRAYRTWTEALSGLIERLEDAGILVMVSGIVGSNTHRVLDPKEFRGFTLVDDLAPLIFINGADTKAAQIFTLAHELGHILLAKPGVDRPDASLKSIQHTERWCSRFAAEFLVPMQALNTKLSGPTLVHDLEREARRFRVSTLVILKRFFDAGLFEWETFKAAYDEEVARVIELAKRAGSGGNFYYTQPYRVGRSFARALISNTLEGETLHRDAFHLLGVRSPNTFNELGEYLGVA